MKRRFLWLMLLFLLAACASPAVDAPEIRIVLEEGEGFTADRYTALARRGEAVLFRITEAEGWAVTGCDYPGATLTRDGAGLLLRLTPRYSAAVALAAEKSDLAFTYYNKEEALTLPVTASHLRLNTAPAGLFSRVGATLYGWETAEGRRLPLGARVSPAEGAELHALWAEWTDAADFDFAEGVITGCHGAAETLVIPAAIDGVPVTAIGAGAFRGCAAKTVILPESITTLAPGAFENAALSTLCLFDSVSALTDYAFTGCDALTTLFLSAAERPAYAGSYYATLADKLDRLEALRDKPKLVLFSGSSARFGYDCALLDEAFPEYEVVNLGVFAYANALPQLELIRPYLLPGDLLLLSPELDAAKRQFCTTNALDAGFFKMMEADYGRLAELDLREYSHVFSALSEYLASRQGMARKSWALSPAAFDEDGNPTDTPSYNAYGDYILYRPNAASDAPLYGLPVPYVATYYGREQYLEPFCRELARFTEAGVRVFYTWSPRNENALSPESDAESIAALERYFQENIPIPFLTSLQSSLLPGRWFYGTDNHLTTEGAKMRTGEVAAALRAAVFTNP